MNETRETILERALAALLTHKDDKGQGVLLLQHDETLAWLALETSGERIAVWSPPLGSPEQVAEAFKQLVKLHNSEGPPVFFVIAGGEEGSTGARELVRAAKPRLEMTQLGFYHLGRTGSLTAIARQLPWLEDAMEKITSAPPLDDALIQGAMQKTRIVAAQQAEIAGKLSGKYTVTAALTAACVVLFVLRFAWSDGGTTDHLLRMGANYGPSVKAGEWHRLFASAFLHADIIHLVANSVALWAFGPVLEALLGPRRFLVLYGASALAGSVASAFLTDPRMSVGASGAVWGLMTAGIAVVYRPNGLLPAHMLAEARKRAWAPLALNLMYSFRPGVDFLAHLGGGALGAALILTGVLTTGLAPLGSAPVSRRDARGEKPLWTGLAGLIGLAMLGSIVMGMAQGKPWESGKPPVMVRTPIADTGVSLELPDVVTGDYKLETGEGAPSHLYGKVGDDPFLFEIEVHPLDAPIAPEALEGELEELRKTLQEKPQPDTKPVGAPRIENIGAYRAVVVEVKLKNDVPVKTCFVFTGTRAVIVRAYGVAERPKSWAGIEEQIVASVRAD